MKSWTKSGLRRVTLIEDLEKVLLDAMIVICISAIGLCSGRDTLFCYVCTGIYSDESMPKRASHKILCYLEYDYKTTDYWIGELKTETIWQSIFRLGLRNTNSA